MSRLSELYKKTITNDLMSKLNIKNIHEVPKINKIILNMGIGEAKDDAKIVDKAVEESAQADLVSGGLSSDAGLYSGGKFATACSPSSVSLAL